MNAEMRARAAALAEKCEDSYSFDRYRSWPAVAAELLKLGFSEGDAETIMRSKYTRWAADSSDAEYGRVPASAVVDFLRQQAPHLRRDLGIDPPATLAKESA